MGIALTLSGCGGAGTPDASAHSDSVIKSVDQMRAVMPELVHMPVGWSVMNGTGVYTAAEVKAMDSCRTNPHCVPGLLFSAVNGYQTEAGDRTAFTASAFDSPERARKMYDARIKGWEKAEVPSTALAPIVLPALGDAAGGRWLSSVEEGGEPARTTCSVEALVGSVVVSVSCSTSEGRPDPELPVDMTRLIVSRAQQALNPDT
ncbi:hypothetical protein ABZ615_18160 [Streptomyces sp. NPDC007325]|uniref:hypothetical protein n=1 Tax=Streptomyces sp. NPDC007325 TaxID=3154588 RepID=UPI0033F43382